VGLVGGTGQASRHAGLGLLPENLPNFGHLEPMVDATVTERSERASPSSTVALADAGYWHSEHVEPQFSRRRCPAGPPRVSNSRYLNLRQLRSDPEGAVELHDVLVSAAQQCRDSRGAFEMTNQCGLEHAREVSGQATP
jgi:hypothetical protein